MTSKLLDIAPVKAMYETASAILGYDLQKVWLY
jgi:hypothetical protein